MMMRWPIETRCNAWFSRAHHRARAGVSLLEVVFAIGIVMIGLVGIAALLPVGGALARRGAVADASAKVGSNAWREFRVRGMANPEYWRWYDGGPWRNPTVEQAGRTFPRPNRSFCLDPLLISAASQNGMQSATNYFPLPQAVGGTNAPQMQRITLGSANSLLSRSVAEELFRSDDDLVFERPSDRTLGPRQIFTYQDEAKTVPLKRTADRHISWMATIVPKLEDCLRGRPTDQYILSIVVFYRRVIDPDLDIIGERVVQVADFYGGNPALSGGDMMLQASSGQDSEDLELASGDWIMLSRRMTAGAEGVNVHKWYRVANAGELSNTSPATRDVTLIGPDWIRDESRKDPTYATIVDGVVNVVEKTIRLESSSLWTQ